MLITIKLKFCSVFALHYSRSQADFFCGQPWPEAWVVLWNGRIRFLEWWGSHKKRYFSRYDMVQNPGMAGSDIRDTAGKKRSRRTQYCVKSVQIWTFFWSVFSRIRTEYGEIRSIFPYSVRIRENTDQKKLGIWTLFTQRRQLQNVMFFKQMQLYTKTLYKNSESF